MRSAPRGGFAEGCHGGPGEEEGQPVTAFHLLLFCWGCGLRTPGCLCGACFPSPPPGPIDSWDRSQFALSPLFFSFFFSIPVSQFSPSTCPLLKWQEHEWREERKRGRLGSTASSRADTVVDAFCTTLSKCWFCSLYSKVEHQKKYHK